MHNKRASMPRVVRKMVLVMPGPKTATLTKWTSNIRGRGAWQMQSEPQTNKTSSISNTTNKTHIAKPDAWYGHPESSCTRARYISQTYKAHWVCPEPAASDAHTCPGPVTSSNNWSRGARTRAVWTIAPPARHWQNATTTHELLRAQSSCKKQNSCH
jgi:hypothetical protein